MFSLLLPKNIRRPKLVVVVILVLCGLLLAAINLAGWRYLYQMKTALDDELGQRLLLAARMVDIRTDKAEIRALLMEHDTLSGLLIRSELMVLKQELNLERIFLADINGIITACTDDKLEGDNLGRYLTTDTLVRPPVPGVAPLYEIAGHYFRAAAVPLFDQFGKPLGTLAVETNAHFLESIRTFRRRLMAGTIASLAAIALIFVFLASALAALVRMQGALDRAERLALLGGAAAHIAHELRNPLGIIKSTSDLIRRRYQSPAKPDELFSYIDDEVRRLNEMVDHFLHFAREKDPDRRPHRLDELVDEVIAGLRPSCAERGITVELTASRSLPEFAFDRDAVKQVLLNLLLNARDAIAGPGRITLELTLRTLRGVPCAACRVTDTGHGVPPDIQPKLFTPFFTTKTTGSGLGLAISQKIADQHHGQLLLENTSSSGTTFTLILPLRG